MESELVEHISAEGYHPRTSRHSDNDVERLNAIFSSSEMMRRRSFVSNGGRLVHYTRAEAALSILESEEIWMRNAKCMEDFMEIQHGFENLLNYFENKANKAEYFASLDACYDGLAHEVLDLFDGWWASIEFNTYITSLSEHDDLEDRTGRLSMWRAYSRDSVGVALVVKTDTPESETDIVNVISSPVSYLPREMFLDEMAQLVSNVQANLEFLKTQPRETLVDYAYNNLLLGAICSKHPGFAEEREWRILHMPKQRASPILKPSTEVVSGVPQQVYKLPLKNDVTKGLTGVSLSEIIDRIIVGPSNYSHTIYEAFVDALTRSGIKDASSKVVSSDIPLRNSGF